MTVIHAELWDVEGIPWKRVTLDTDCPEVEMAEPPEIHFDYTRTYSEASTLPAWRIRRFRRDRILGDGVIIYREISAAEAELRRPWGQR